MGGKGQVFLDKLCKKANKIILGSVILSVLLSLFECFILQQLSLLRIKIYLLVLTSLALILSTIKLYREFKHHKKKVVSFILFSFFMCFLVATIILFNPACYLLYGSGEVTDENAYVYCELAEMNHYPSENVVNSYYSEYVYGIYNQEYLLFPDEKIFSTLNKCDEMIRNDYIKRHLPQLREKLLQIKIDLETVYISEDSLIRDYAEYSDSQLLIIAEDEFIKENYEKAIEYYKYLILRGTNSSISYNNIAYIYSKLHNYELAKFYYYKAYEAGSEIAMGNLVLIYYEGLLTLEEYAKVINDACLSKDERMEEYLEALYSGCEYELQTESLNYIADFLEKSVEEKVEILSLLPKKEIYVIETRPYIPAGGILISTQWVPNDEGGYNSYTYKRSIEVMGMDYPCEEIFDYID